MPIAIGPVPNTKPLHPRRKTKGTTEADPILGTMKTPTGKELTIGGVTIGVIAAAIFGASQIQDRADLRYVGQEVYAAQSLTKQVQIINVQIVQTETQLEIIEQRKKENKPRDGDGTRYEKLLDAIKRLEAAREEMLRK